MEFVVDSTLGEIRMMAKEFELHLLKGSVAVIARD